MAERFWIIISTIIIVVMIALIVNGAITTTKESQISYRRLCSPFPAGTMVQIKLTKVNAIVISCINRDVYIRLPDNTTLFVKHFEIVPVNGEQQ